MIRPNTKTILDLVQDSTLPLTLHVGTHSYGPLQTVFALRLERIAGDALTVAAVAQHTDPEGAFAEVADAAAVLEASTEDEFAEHLAGIVFESGARPNLNRYDELLTYFPALFR
jgi:hypothetical protein